MEMKIHCPGCAKALRVPKSSSGRRARCPNCRRVFVVPKPSELVEETFSTWIEDDVQELEKEHDKQWEEIASIRAYRSGAARAGGSLVGVTVADDPSRSGKNDGQGEPAPVEAVEASTVLARAEPADQEGEAPVGVAVAAEGGGAPGAASPPAATAADAAVPQAAAAAEAPAPAVAVKRTAPIAAAGPRPTVGRRVEGESFPTELDADASTPHLVVLSCLQGGVTFAFDSIHLLHHGFRCSIPVACAYSGETNRQKLFVRPLAFIDQSGAKVRSPQDIENKRTTHIGPNQSPADLLSVLGDMEELPKPFNTPMPYYISHDQGHLSVKCTTESRPESGITCKVFFPNTEIGLMWLANVNGICGVEYALLEREVALLANDAWRQLSDACRQRLNVWCPFEQGEQFRVYLSDGDFGKKDEGLAGIVVTSQRIIYCKYHHRGSVPLEEPVTVYVRKDGDFAILSAESAEGRFKLVKLHFEEVPLLLAELEPHPQVQVLEK